MVSYKDLLLTLGQTRSFYDKNFLVCKGIHSKLHVDKTGAFKSRNTLRKKFGKILKLDYIIIKTCE